MNLDGRKFEIFYPDNYSPDEKKSMDELKARVESEGGAGLMVDRTVTLEKRDAVEYARLWDRWNPLFNSEKYAEKTKWRRMPTLPCFSFGENISGFPMMDEAGRKLGDLFYYANDGGDIELFEHVYPGDVLTFKSTTQHIKDSTPESGSALRSFNLYGETEMLRNGRVVGRGKGYGRNAMMRFADGGPVPSVYEQTYEWLDYIPPVHTTTENEWSMIRELWKNEEIRGSKKRYWDEVKIGDRLTPVCSGPVSDIDMFRLHGDMICGMPDTRGFIEEGQEGFLITDKYGQKINFMARHYSYCRNEGARAVFYNFTARNFIIRMLTNWMGDDGFLRGFKWRFQNLFRCMAGNEPGKEFLAKVPSMSGRFVNRHGMEGDTAICMAEVTDLYIRDGLYLANVVCWAETFDGDVIQVVEATVELPKK